MPGPYPEVVGRTVAFIPHVHWDREWYRPFETFRMSLVELLDALLPRLEADPSYAHFLLDGQMAAVDDYLAVRPGAEATLRRLSTAGRLSVGPWYVLADEFCVSGETLVRNLQWGMERAETFGGAMAVGYLPDSFGHAAQMPQLLRQAGFDHAVVWRGVPSAIDRTAFRWSAPDGSTVRAEYLPVGYGNGAFVPDDAKQLLARVRAHEAEVGALLEAEDALLWMNGGDHQRPQPWLGRVLAEANEEQDDYRLLITSLEEYLATAPATGLPEWTGELRSGARANLLPGVLSNRVDVKQAAAGVERALEREAEPLCALFLPPAQWPEAFLRSAWLEVLRNAAHDSSCACSVDEVVDAVLNRYAAARQIAAGLTQRALAAVAASLGGQDPVVVNSSARTRSGLVELVLGGSPPPGTQPLAVVEAATIESTITGRELSTAIGHTANEAWVQGGVITAADALEAPEDIEVLLRTGPAADARPSVGADLSHLYALGGAHRHEPVRLRVEHTPYCRVLTHVADVPGYGWRTCEPATGSGVRNGAIIAPVRTPERGVALDNGLVRVEVDPDAGTFSLNGHRGLDRLVDGGDAGDTYNYSPPAGDVIVDDPSAVAVEMIERGPWRAALLVTRTYHWPERVDAEMRHGERSVVVTTRLELRAGEGLVRVTTSLDNRCRDHRLRSWFPLPEPASSSRAECAFTVVTRGLEAEGGPHERAIPTFPTRRFVSAGGLTLVHEGLLEYELVDRPAPALALTLLRGIGVLSGTDLAFRPMPAGPPVAVEGAQMQGPQVLRYGVALGPADPYALADDAFLPLAVVVGTGTGSRPAAGSALSVSGAEVSAVRRVGEKLEVRVFNPTDHETTVTLAGRSGWLVDLRRRPVAPFTESFRLRPHGIATLLLPET
jgi:hypothetical protein